MDGDVTYHVTYYYAVLSANRVIALLGGICSVTVQQRVKG